MAMRRKFVVVPDGEAPLEITAADVDAAMREVSPYARFVHRVKQGARHVYHYAGRRNVYKVFTN